MLLIAVIGEQCPRIFSGESFAFRLLGKSTPIIHEFTKGLFLYFLLFPLTSVCNRCNDADYTSKFRRIRPGAYWAQRVLGYSELPPGFNFMTVDFIWLEIPLSQIGKGHDFDFNVLRQMPASVIINRFQNLAQELNQKDRFAVSAAREKDVDLVFPDTLTTPVENDSILDRAIGQDELWLAKPAFGGAGKGIELFRYLSLSL